MKGDIYLQLDNPNKNNSSIEHFESDVDSSPIVVGKYYDEKDLDTISNYVLNKYDNNGKGRHIWFEELQEKPIYNVLNKVRQSDQILSVFKEKFPEHEVYNMKNIDEIYFSVNPKKASNSDRMLVDCHYDTPWYYLVNGGIEIYRVLVACTENKTVETSIPKENLSVFINKTDFYGIRYHKDYHCVHGNMDDDKFRVVLKIHFMIIPKTYPENSFNERFIKSITENWTHASRYAMNQTNNPTSTFGRVMTNSIVSLRWMFNYLWVSLFFLVLIIVIIYYFTKKMKFSKFSKNK